MFENSILVTAIIRDLNRDLNEVDRRAFYGPDASGVSDTPRRKNRVARFFRREPNVN